MEGNKVMREIDTLYPQRTSSTLRINAGVMVGLGWSAFTKFKEIELQRLCVLVLNPRRGINWLFKNRGTFRITP